jgi:hypothetical protein
VIKNNLAEFKQKLRNPSLFQPIESSIHSSDAYDIEGMERDSAAVDLEVEEMIKSMKKEQRAKTNATEAIQQQIAALTIAEETSKQTTNLPLRHPSIMNPKGGSMFPVVPSEALFTNQLNLLPPAHQISQLNALSPNSKLDSEFRGYGSPNLSNLRLPITSNLPTDVDVDRLLEKIERQEEKKMRSALVSSDSNYQVSSHNAGHENTDFSEINHLLNLIENRIKVYIHLATNLLQACNILYKKQVLKQLFFKGIVYSLIYHGRNLVNKVLQLLSQEESGDFIFPNNWDSYLESHDHSIQTDNFTNLAAGIYKALWSHYKKMEPVLRSNTKNPLMMELKKMMHAPDSRLSDISESLDTFLTAVDTSIKSSLSSLSGSAAAMPKEALYLIRTQLMLARVMYNLGVFTDAEAYRIYDLDELIQRNLGKWDATRTAVELITDLNLTEAAFNCFDLHEDEGAA